MGADRIIYEVMHMEKIVASISSTGNVKITDEKFMPYDLYLEEKKKRRCLVEGFIY